MNNAPAERTTTTTKLGRGRLALDYCDEMGHVRVAVCLGFEVSLGAQPLKGNEIEWLCTRTRFETEACSNSERGFFKLPNNIK